MQDRISKAEALFDIKRYDEALEAALEALASEPDDLMALYIGAFSALLLKDSETAKRLARSLIVAYPEGPQGHEIMGFLATDANKNRVAETHFREARRLDPENATYTALLSGYLARVGRMEEAITIGLKGLKLDPEDASVLNALETAYRLNDEPEQAARYGERALAANPEGAESHLEAGFRLLESGQRGAARGNFIESLRLDPAAGDSMEVIAYERVRTLWFFKNGRFLPLDKDVVATAVLTPAVWYGLSYLWQPFVNLAWLSVVLVAAAYAYVGLFHLGCRIALARLKAGKG